MHKRALLVGYASIFLLVATLVGLFVVVVPVTANPSIINVPAQFSTIQAAINAASRGDTIMVHPGTYPEHVIVNKTLTLVGENESTTIIDGGGIGTVVTVRADNVTLTGFTIQNGGSWPYCGLFAGNYTGITISNNTIVKNGDGLDLFGTVGGNIVSNKMASNGYAGIHISGGTNNLIHGNTIANNVLGAWISSAGTAPNTFYLNNFISNTTQVQDFGSSVWDNSSIKKGNFWSDYEERYPNAVENDTSGVWNTSYVEWGIVDEYPLVKPYPSETTPPVADAGPNQMVFQGMTVTFDGSNSTDAVGIKSYVWTFTDVTPKTLTGVHPTYRFRNVGNFTVMLNVTNYADLWDTDTMGVNVSADTTPPVIGTVSQNPKVPGDGVPVTITVNVTDTQSGVGNVTISYRMNSGSWTNVSMSKLTGDTWEGEIPGLPGGTNVTYKIIAYDNAGNLAVNDNAGKYYVYTVVPEFPAAIILPLFIIATLVAAFLEKRKRTPKS
jgi:parallel beta-helix repeat protein